MSDHEDVIFSPLRDDLIDEITRLRAREAVLVGLLSETLEWVEASSLYDRIENALATLDVPDPKEQL